MASVTGSVDAIQIRLGSAYWGNVSRIAFLKSRWAAVLKMMKMMPRILRSLRKKKKHRSLLGNVRLQRTVSPVPGLSVCWEDAFVTLLETPRFPGCGKECTRTRNVAPNLPSATLVRRWCAMKRRQNPWNTLFHRESGGMREGRCRSLKEERTLHERGSSNSVIGARLSGIFLRSRSLY